MSVALALCALPVLAAETWSCNAIKECRGDGVRCEALDKAFPLTIDGNPGVLQMTTYRGDLALPLTVEGSKGRIFSATADAVDYAITLTDDGQLEARMPETMFWDGVIDHTMTANCRRDPA